MTDIEPSREEVRVVTLGRISDVGYTDCCRDASAHPHHESIPLGQVRDRIQPTERELSAVVWPGGHYDHVHTTVKQGT